MLHQSLSRTWLTVITVACALGVSASAGPFDAQTPKPVGEITGTVIDARTQKPVSDSRVTLTLVGQRVPGAGDTVVADVPSAARTLNSYTALDGRFSFRPPAVGRYMLTVRKPGFPSSSFGQQSPEDRFQWFDIRQDDVVSDVVLRLWPGATISGTIRSRGGEPVAGRWLRLLDVRNDQGTRRLLPVIQAVGEPTTTTNDRGEYWFTGLSAGRYLVESSPSKPRASVVDIVRMLNNPSRAKWTEPGVAYPTAPWPTDADVVTVGVGEERTRVDFALPDGPPTTYAVSGRVEGLEFSPLGQKIGLFLAGATTHLPPYLEVALTTIESDGAFAFTHVPPGRYLIRSLLWPGADPARSNSPGIGPLDQQIPIEGPNLPRNAWLSEELVVSDKDITGLVVRARRGARVHGSLVLTAELSVWVFSQAWITVKSLDGWNLAGLPVGRVEADGTFSSPTLPPGKYSIVPSGLGNQWFPESSVLLDKNVLGSGVEVRERDVDQLTIKLSSLKAHVMGAVTDNAGKTRPDAYVLFFRQDGSWQSGSAGEYFVEVGHDRTDRFGQYDIDLNAGDYFIIALAGSIGDAWQDAAFLRSLIPQATKVSLARGRRVPVPLVVRTISK